MFATPYDESSMQIGHFNSWKHLGSSDAYVPLKFQSDTMI